MAWEITNIKTETITKEQMEKEISELLNNNDEQQEESENKRG